MKWFRFILLLNTFFITSSAGSRQADSTPPSVKMKRVESSVKPKNLGATSTYTWFDYNQTKAVQSGMMPRAGCGCEDDAMEVSPEFGIATHVGQPVELRYDASVICHRQMIKDMSGKFHKNVDQIGDLTVGTVKWEIGSVWALPLEWGIATYSGYKQTGVQEVTFSIELQCDDNAENCPRICTKTKKISVTVLP